MGTGPIRGFAVTLAIGIVTTVFTAFTLTRWLIAVWLKRSKPTNLPAGLVHYLPLDPKLNIMRWRNLAFALSAGASLVIAVLFATVEMNYGVDFKGGSMIEVQAKDGLADAGEVRARLGEVNIGDVQVQEFGEGRDLMIRVEGQAEGGDNAEQSVLEKVRGALESDYEFRRVEVVGPTVSSELAMTGTIGIIASMFAMLLYVWFRFEWQFAVGAIVSTLHDVIMMVGLYVIAGLEFNLSSIAAILTVVGYSINDTVVIYDRVRENLRRYKKMPIIELLNLSLSQTLSRTFLTGLTTLFALIALYMFGGEVISSFMLAMLFGVIVGTYSSIFVAGPLLILFKLRGDMFDKDKDAVSAQTAQPSKS
jgi:SecD/SecF fusion protein